MYKYHHSSCNLVTNRQIKSHKTSCSDVVFSNALLLYYAMSNVSVVGLERLTFASLLQFPFNLPAWKAFTGGRDGGGGGAEGRGGEWVLEYSICPVSLRL